MSFLVSLGFSTKLFFILPTITGPVMEHRKLKIENIRHVRMGFLVRRHFADADNIMRPYTTGKQETGGNQEDCNLTVQLVLSNRRRKIRYFACTRTKDRGVSQHRQDDIDCRRDHLAFRDR